MKKTATLILMAIFFTSYNYGQELQKQLSIRAGFLGGWVSYEQPVSNTILINGELGYLGGIVGGEFLFTSIIEIEPRYYYNFKKRIQRGKRTQNNSANYISLHTSYIPNILTASKYESLEVIKSFNLIPTYGLRRNISGGLNFDFEIGIGYQILHNMDNEVIPNLGIGISYTF